MTLLDVCVVSYRTPRYLDEFIESYREIKNHDTNLFVRVNDPVEEDMEVLNRDREGFHPRRTVGDNLGYARSVNYLVDQGSADYVGIFNADARLTSDVWDCIDYMKQNVDVGVLGPRQVDASGRLTCGGGVIGSQRKPQFRGWRARDSAKFHTVEDVVGVMGAIYFMPRAVWNELSTCSEYRAFMQSRFGDGMGESGAFLPTEHFYEETFCTYHARAHGYRVVYYGPAKMFHGWQKSGKPKKGVMERSKSLFIEACQNVHAMECES